MTARNEDIDLGNFEGKTVLATSVAVTNAGDGLSEALAVDPQILHQGDRGAILLEYEVAKVRFDPVKDTSGLTRVHILKAKTGTLLDLEEASERLDEQRRRIAEASGQEELPFDGDGEPESVGDVIDREHVAAGLDDAIGVLEDEENASDPDAAWRRERTAELDGMDLEELAGLVEEYDLDVPDGVSKATLVDAICVYEETLR